MYVYIQLYIYKRIAQGGLSDFAVALELGVPAGQLAEACLDAQDAITLGIYIHTHIHVYIYINIDIYIYMYTYLYTACPISLSLWS